MLLVYLTNDTTHYINSLVVNNPERYVEVLHCFIDLFVQSKGALEQVTFIHVLLKPNIVVVRRVDCGVVYPSMIWCVNIKSITIST